MRLALPALCLSLALNALLLYQHRRPNLAQPAPPPPPPDRWRYWGRDMVPERIA